MNPAESRPRRQWQRADCDRDPRCAEARHGRWIEYADIERSRDARYDAGIVAESCVGETKSVGIPCASITADDRR